MRLPELFIWANGMEGERFQPVNGFDGRFWISDFGRLVSYDHRKNTIKFMRCSIDKEGYYATQLRMKPINRKLRVHTLVAEHFVEKKDLSHNVVNHLYGDQLNNYYKDLEWTTLGNNVKHAVKIGLFNIKGERHPNSKLKEPDILKIRSLYLEGFTHKEIAKKYGICRRQAGDIVNRKNWSWLN